MLRLTLLALLVLTATAHAYRIDPVIPAPQVKYFAALDDWKAPMARAARAVNRARVGVKLVKAQIPEQASVQIGRLDKTCGLAGVDGTTQTLEGGYAVIYLPRGCNATQASIIAAHELGHALGLAHENRRCALMNASGTGPNSIPTQCLGRRIDWRRKPFRRDDLEGLRKAYRNTRPKVTMTATVTGSTAALRIRARDKERNLSELEVDFGDGRTETYDPAEPPTSHTYGAPGTYAITATATDFYGKRGSRKVTVVVLAARRALAK